MKTLIFDFDGVIGDTFGTVSEIMGELSVEFGLKNLDKEGIKKLKSQGVKKTIQSAKIPAWKLPLLLKRVREEQAKRIEETTIFKGVKEILRELKRTGSTLGILTSNSEENVKTILEKNDLQIFDFIVSKSSLFGKAKILKSIIKEKKLSPKEVYYVGDEVRDIEAAKKAEVKSIAVSWGYDSVKILVKLKPDYLINKPEGLLIIIKEVR